MGTMAEGGKKEKIDMANFDWAKLEEEIRSDETGRKYNQSDKEKFQEKIAENPWVPVGATATAGILILGLISFATKRTRCVKPVCSSEPDDGKCPDQRRCRGRPLNLTRFPT